MPFFIAWKTNAGRTLIVSHSPYQAREEAVAIAAYGEEWHQVVEAESPSEAARLVEG